ncbi:septation protein SepH [uncultured Gulosibacter sp.]|uniref:septation protein SepH n=1 Tax=uncultured Gulosibacter sp. TaxID=1339167 RepID=UPI00288A57D3|nr:septation protein SepH [uncultured Gulosibacter sp.]
MQELRFVGVEQGAVIATNADGERFRLVIDEALRNALRPQPEHRQATAKTVPPRLIQQLIRAGRTVAEVVDQTGADEEIVERFEGPILAERGYLVEQARAVPVRLQQAIDPLSGEGATFGSTIDERLEQLGAERVRWDAWKDPDEGWRIGIDFTTDDVERNALWAFDPKSQSLDPLTPAATNLSQQDGVDHAGAPHLRVVDHGNSVIPITPDDQSPDTAKPDTTTQHHNTQFDTADLLNALRRRRGERASDPYDEEAEYVEDEFDDSFGNRLSEATATRDEHSATVTPFRPGSTNTPRVVDIPLAGLDEDGDLDAGGDAGSHAAVDATEATEHRDKRSGKTDRAHGASARDSSNSHADLSTAVREMTEGELAESRRRSQTNRPGETGPLGRRGKSGRAQMPSWDEIVFGTRSDD